MNLKRSLGLILTLSIVILLVACSGSTEEGSKTNGSSSNNQESSNKEENLRLATASQAGVFYANGAALEQLANEEMDGIKIFPQATGGSGDNINLLKDKEVDIALVHNSTAIPAYTGTYEYEGNAMQDFAAITVVWKSHLHYLVSKDSGIETPADIKGETFQVGPIGSGIEKFTLQPLSVYNITIDDLDAQRLSVAEAVDQIKNRQLTGMIHGSSIPDGNATDLMSSGDVVLIGMEDDKVQQLQDKYDNIYSPSVIPAGTYPNQNEDINTAASSALLVVRKDIDEDIVYKLTKTIMENNDFLVGLHSSFNETNLENALTGHGPIPIHPGAEMYYQEAGIID